MRMRTRVRTYSLDPSRECNCNGRVRKRGGEKGLIFQLRNLTNQILLVGMQIVGFQVPVAEVYVALNFFGFQDVDCVIET